MENGWDNTKRAKMTYFHCGSKLTNAIGEMVTLSITIDSEFYYREYTKMQKKCFSFRLSLLYLSHTKSSLVHLLQNNV